MPWARWCFGLRSPLDVFTVYINNVVFFAKYVRIKLGSSQAVQLSNFQKVGQVTPPRGTSEKAQHSEGFELDWDECAQQLCYKA